ncbi:hypothetical protein ANN_11258 [Periplaneta americana]|uniref:Uncharacterized protein n=1 Tax=Periplaneta americana TaxID=6978 RepID=A0ABQ8T4H5_PERAM|nr:hypothetical protein ANN_11258 [Periplaneta americana]
MADTSEYTIEERLVAAMGVHERQVNSKSMKNVMEYFVARFENAAPPRLSAVGKENGQCSRREGHPQGLNAIQTWHNLSKKIRSNPHGNVLLKWEYQNQLCEYTLH